ncbi:MAG: DUF2158 domain-containing protein [Rhizomicrobium sp.]|nr:DUF2158 domain-containing protein [Rhizomicrobium sp.]
MAEITVGMVVTLKSGGPTMTVEAIDQTSGPELVARCLWFTDNQRNEGDFPLTALTPSP